MSRRGHRKSKRSEGASKVQAERTNKTLIRDLKRRIKKHPVDKVALKRLQELKADERQSS